VLKVLAALIFIPVFVLAYILAYIRIFVPRPPCLRCRLNGK